MFGYISLQFILNKYWDAVDRCWQIFKPMYVYTINVQTNIKPYTYTINSVINHNEMASLEWDIVVEHNAGCIKSVNECDRYIILFNSMNRGGLV